MNPKQQNLAIAEASEAITGDIWGPLYKTRHGLVRDCPDYVGDLNAINSAILSVLNCGSSQQNWDYCRILGIVTGSGEHITTALVHATAEQRAESFLKTLGKWVES